MPDEQERRVHNATPTETLKRIGSTQVVTGVSTMGAIDAQHALSAVELYKQDARYMATMGEEPVDENGLGYVYTNTTVNET